MSASLHRMVNLNTDQDKKKLKQKESFEQTVDRKSVEAKAQYKQY